MKPLNFREQDFKRDVEKQPYSKQIRDEFFEYWSEPDRGQSPKMRFEKEKTWDLGRRLARWARKNNEGKAQLVVNGQQKPPTELDRLDSSLMKYKSNPTDIRFEDLALFYDYLKANKLMKTFTQDEIYFIKSIYGEDNKKCRAYCVSETFKGYINNGLTFSDIIKMREKLNKTV